MSDTIVHSPGPDRNRTIRSLVAALAIHIAVLLIVAIFARLGMAAATQTPTIIDVQLQGGQVAEEPSGTGTPAGGSPAAVTGPPIAVRGPAAPGPRAASSSAGDGGFVIPTPSGRSTDSSAVPSGPSFQTGGARTGVAESLPAVQSTEPQPTVTVGQKGKTGAGPSSGSGSTQRSGEGVVVTGSTGKNGSDSLDLSQLDKAMAGGGSGSAAGGGGSGTASSGTRTAPGGTGAGGTGSGGTGTGGAGSGGAGTGGTGSGGYSVQWEQPDASKGRTLISHPAPKIPQWVSAQGLTLSVKVAFTLLPNGVVSAASLDRSTGYADVDSAVVDAIRQWRFSAAKGGGPVKGVIPYIIKTR